MIQFPFFESLATSIRSEALTLWKRADRAILTDSPIFKFFLRLGFRFVLIICILVVACGPRCRGVGMVDAMPGLLVSGLSGLGVLV